MIRTVVLNKELTEGSLHDLGKRKGFVWVDCTNPIKDELEVISDKTGIPLEDLKEVLDEDERPRVAEHEHYALIVFRAPVHEGHETETTPLSIFVGKNWVVTLRLRDIVPVDRLHKQSGTARLHLVERGPGHFVYRLLDEVLLSYFSIMDKVEERIDAVEVRVFRRPERPTAREIFALKKILIYFHKALAANREVIAGIEKEYLKQIPRQDLKNYRNLYNDIVELIDLESTYRDILTGTLDMYLSTVSNNLNQIMKKLTALASFVLIPTLITGIYGMNFAFMPEVGWKYGYFIALGLMVFSVALLYVYFKKKRWL